MATETILVTGALGQIGTDLVEALRIKYGNDKVVAADIRHPENVQQPFEQADVLDKAKLTEIIQKHNCTKIYHLAALLSGTSEQKPQRAWEINMMGLMNVLDICVELGISKIFWPSSIAVFGPTTPRENTPQYTVMEPTTVYGISKLAGERWCEYYNLKRGLDVRSIRYPGLISYKAQAGGGTTDYAVDIYFEAIKEGKFECFLKEDTALPMMYMNDAVKATIQLMEADKENLSSSACYNVSALSFSPKEITNEIQKIIPELEVTYKPDFRQQIADSWPMSIDDSEAKKDWNWQPDYTLEKMTKDMIENIKSRIEVIPSGL